MMKVLVPPPSSSDDDMSLSSEDEAPSVKSVSRQPSMDSISSKEVSEATDDKEPSMDYKFAPHSPSDTLDLGPPSPMVPSPSPKKDIEEVVPRGPYREDCHIRRPFDYKRKFVPPRHWERYPRKPKRQVTYHKNAVAALAIYGKGFTLTDGRTSLSEDGFVNWKTIAQEVYDRRIQTLYLVGDFTQTTWDHIKKEHWPLVENVTVETVEQSSDSRCYFCKKPHCHRWMATILGIAKVIKFPIDPIRH